MSQPGFVGIIGYHNSGKTYLSVKMIEYLTSKGLKVGAVKHVAHKELAHADKDTDKYSRVARKVLAISKNESMLIINGSWFLESFQWAFKDLDLVIVEGFKENKTFPKIIVARSLEEYKELKDGLEIAVVTREKDKFDQIMDIPVFSFNETEKISELAINKAFKLPNLNCGECGFNSCYEMAKAINQGVKTLRDCKILSRSRVRIEIDGSTLPINEFVAAMIEGGIRGMISNLKGYRAGKIKITLE